MTDWPTTLLRTAWASCQRLAACGASAMGLFWLAAGAGSAQDLDVVLYAGDPTWRSVSDQVEDDAERKAFEALKAAEDPARKRALAEDFLKRFPQSWLTSFAHALAAKACIALDDLQAGLDHGRQSLQILPEGGTLLVTLANVQVHAGLLKEAETSAADALELLGRFRRPSTYTATEWARIERDLRASAHYVLGRVEATRGLRSAGQRQAAHLIAADRALRRALGLNPADGIAALLLGIVEHERGNVDSALSAFASAAQTPGPAQSRAIGKLRGIYQASGRTDQSWPEFQSGIPPLRLDPPLGEDTMTPGANAAARYAGSASCAECHREVSVAWAQTGMAKMFRPYAPQNVIGDFSANNEFRDASGRTLARMFIEDDQHYFELPAGDGHERYRIDYTIGSKWQQAYATRLPNGHIHVVPIQYNRIHGQWVNFWEILDDGPSERSAVQDFHQMKSSTSYQVHCSACHTSQVQAEGSVIAPERITFRETGVNCEMCHGPSQSHADAMRQGRPEAGDAAVPPLRFDNLDHRAYVNVCGQCHLQSGIIEAGTHGEINYSGDQVAFLNQRKQRPYEEYSRSAFYKDGRFRETTFIVESFMRSQCFRKGEAHCGNCHDPHPADSANNPTSLKFREEPNRMCLQCHGAMAGDVAAHTRHPADSVASRCAACHMPSIMNSMMFLAGTHRIDDIPNAEMTQKFGREESPNACLSCHEEESATWLARQLAAWQPRRPVAASGR